MSIDTIPINQTLPAISCDYQSLREWAAAITGKYRDLTITEDQVKDIKSDMAELNKGKQKLERARIDTVKAISAPIRKFEAEIKAISRLFDEAYSSLANQVKAFEDAERQRKKSDVVDVIITMECGFANLDNSIIQFDPRWLNKATSKEAIRKDIKAQIEAYKQAQNSPLMAVAAQSNNQSTKEENAPEKANYEPFSIGLRGIAQMEERIAQERRGNPRTIWNMVFSYTPDQAEEVRQIFQECQFMRIVRRLNSVGIKAEIFKQEA